MLKSMVFLTVTVVALIIDDVQGKPIQSLDIERILQSLQQQLQQERVVANKKYQQKKYDNDDDDEGSHYGSLRSQEVEELINLAVKDEARNDRGEESRDRHDSNHRNDNLNQLIQKLQLLERTQNRYDKPLKKRQSKVKKLKSRSDLLGPVYKARESEYNEREENIAGLGDYSNIYVILNADALRKTKNRNKLNDLLSNLISSPRDEEEDHRELRRERRYKGFVLNNPLQALRRRGEKDDIYMGDDSREDKPNKPKRMRSEFGGLGGSRTAIPYVRHRGDIFERE